MLKAPSIFLVASLFSFTSFAFIHSLARNGDWDKVQKLIDAGGIDLSELDNGETILDIAIRQGRENEFLRRNPPMPCLPNDVCQLMCTFFTKKRIWQLRLINKNWNHAIIRIPQIKACLILNWVRESEKLSKKINVLSLRARTIRGSIRRDENSRLKDRDRSLRIQRVTLGKTEKFIHDLGGQLTISQLNAGFYLSL
jgi:hypothetical protein